jgi:hypothetical protein
LPGARDHFSAGAARFHPAPVGEDDRGFDLPGRDRPEPAQQDFLRAIGEQREAVPLIERDCPRRVAPGADQHRLRGQALHALQQRCADALALQGSRNIRVAHQGDFALVLDSHHARRAAIGFGDPEVDSVRDFLTSSSRGM